MSVPPMVTAEPTTVIARARLRMKPVVGDHHRCLNETGGVRQRYEAQVVTRNPA